MREYFHGKNYIKNYRHLGMIGAIELKEIEGVERVGRRIAAIALEKGVLIRPSEILSILCLLISLQKKK